MPVSLMNLIIFPLRLPIPSIQFDHYCSKESAEKQVEATSVRTPPRNGQTPGSCCHSHLQRRTNPRAISCLRRERIAPRQRTTGSGCKSTLAHAIWKSNWPAPWTSCSSNGESTRINMFTAAHRFVPSCFASRRISAYRCLSAPAKSATTADSTAKPLMAPLGSKASACRVCWEFYPAFPPAYLN